MNVEQQRATLAATIRILEAEVERLREGYGRLSTQRERNKTNVAIAQKTTELRKTRQQLAALANK